MVAFTDYGLAVRELNSANRMATSGLPVLSLEKEEKLWLLKLRGNPICKPPNLI